MTYTLYTKHSCETCDYVKQLLTDLELDYVELKLDEDFTLEEYEDKFGETNCPGILKDGKLLGIKGNIVELHNQLEEMNLIQRQIVTELPDDAYMLDKDNTIF